MPQAPVPHVPARQSVPRQRKSLLPRDRLINRLHNNIGSGLTVLEAPAGFGKTALLAQFAADLDYDTCWLTLDSSAAAPEVLAEQLARSLSGDPAFPGPKVVTRNDDLKAYLATAVVPLVEIGARPVLVVLDNVHLLHDAVDSSDLVGWLLEALPIEAEVVLSGREPAPLTEVDRRVASGECLRLGPDDLAFTADEVARLVVGSESTLSPPRVSEVTNGWPAAVMAALAGTVSLEGAPTTSEGAWERYLGTELWRNIPDEVRPLLLRISPAVDLDASTLKALLGREGHDTLTCWLENNGWLVEQVEGGAFRFMPLIHRFLQQQHRREDAGIRAVDIADVAARLEATGRLIDALETARTADNDSLLAGLIERHGSDLILRGSFHLLSRVFAQVEHETLEANPLLRAIRAQVLAHEGKGTEAVHEAVAVLETPGLAQEARVRALLARLRAARVTADLDDLNNTLDQLRVLDVDSDPALLGELLFNEANIEVTLRANFKRGEELLARTIEYTNGTPANALAMLSRSTLGQLHVMKGDGPRAVNVLSRSAREWREVGGSSNLGWVLNNLGMAHITVGDFESAIPVLQEAVREGQSCDNSRNIAYATASLADAQVALGQYDQARANYEEAIRICSEEAPDETLAALSIAGLATAFLGLNDLDQASFFAERASQIAEHFANPFEVGTCHLVEAAIASRTNNPAAAIAVAIKAVEAFRGIEAVGPERTALYRLALCQFRAGARAAAEESLGRAAEITPEPWMAAGLLPLVREEPMFAQWAASRRPEGEPLREYLSRHAMAAPTPGEEQSKNPFPGVSARSFGHLGVALDGHELADEAWGSATARELFFLFLANPHGIRKEQAVAELFPEISEEKRNSAFHSNVYRVRHALYKESIVRLPGGNYALNPEAEFAWDVSTFEATVEQARALKPGSDERAKLYEQALSQYSGPFADVFRGEWAATIRSRTEDYAREAFTTLAGYLAGRGDFEVAVQCLDQLLRRDPLNEEAAFQLASYRVKGGNAAAALSFLDEYRRQYEQELQAAVPGRFTELRSRIAAGQAV